MNINKEKALFYITKAYDKIPSLKKLGRDSQEYHQWKYETDSIVKQIFGESSSEYKSIHTVLFPKYIGTLPGIQIDYQQIYLNRLDSLFAHLKGLETAIEFSCDDVIDKKCDNILILTHILSRFHRFVRQIRERYNNRDFIEVKDEYDVQDLLHAILKLHFDDVRPEEYQPSYAGSSTRVDFLLKNEKIIIEVKKTRPNLKDKEIGEQLISDKAHYRTNPDYKTLVCFIYDPDGLLDNPIGLKNDLSEINSDMNTIVVVCPN